MRLFRFLVALFSTFSLTVAVMPVNFNPLDIDHMVDFIQDQVSKGNFDLGKVVMVADSGKESWASVRNLARTYYKWRPLEMLTSSSDYESRVPDAYRNDFNINGALHQAAYIALGRVAKEIVLYGTEHPDPHSPFFTWVQPAIEARQRAGSSVKLSSLKQGSTDLLNRRSVTISTRSCKRDSCSNSGTDDPDSAAFSATWNQVDDKINNLPHDTLTFEDGSTMDVPKYSDADQKTFFDSANEASTEWQAAVTDNPGPSENTPDPTDVQAPVAPSDPNAPTTVEDPNAPTVQDDPNKPVDPNEDPTKNPSGKPKQAPPARPPPAVRRSARFGPRPSLQL